MRPSSRSMLCSSSTRSFCAATSRTRFSRVTWSRSDLQQDARMLSQRKGRSRFSCAALQDRQRRGRALKIHIPRY